MIKKSLNLKKVNVFFFQKYCCTTIPKHNALYIILSFRKEAATIIRLAQCGRICMTSTSCRVCSTPTACSLFFHPHHLLPAICSSVWCHQGLWGGCSPHVWPAEDQRGPSAEGLGSLWTSCPIWNVPGSGIRWPGRTRGSLVFTVCRSGTSLQLQPMAGRGQTTPLKVRTFIFLNCI